MITRIFSGITGVEIASVSELIFFLLPGVTLPQDHGAMLFWQISNPSAQNPMQSTPFSGSNGTTTEFELIGYISNDKPSGKSALILIYHFIACVC